MPFGMNERNGCFQLALLPRMVIGFRFNNQAFFDISRNFEDADFSKYYLIMTLPSSVPHPHPLLSSAIAAQVMKARLSLLHASAIDWDKAVAAAQGLSHADIAHACEQAVKNAILEHSTTLRTRELIDALEERCATHA